VVEAVNEEKICRLITESYGKIFTVESKKRVLSIYPTEGIRKSVHASLKP